MKIAAEGLTEDGYWAGTSGGASGILPIVKSTGRICLAWRSKYVNKGDRFGVPGGAVKDGKTPAESAYLELREETGYDGEIDIIPAYVFTDGDFSYTNFLGIVPNEFSFKPHEDHAWETDYIEWMSLEEIQQAMKMSPADFHEGVLALFEHSKDLIESTSRGDRSIEKEPDLNRVLAAIHFHSSVTYPPELLDALHRMEAKMVPEAREDYGRCTTSALELQNEVGGVVMGYMREDNPAAALDVDGHDFLVVEDRYLLDAWAAEYLNERDIYDLNSPSDAAEVLKLYGPREAWEVVSRSKTATHKMTPLKDPANYVEETNGWALFPDERESEPNTPLVL